MKKHLEIYKCIFFLWVFICLPVFALAQTCMGQGINSVWQPPRAAGKSFTIWVQHRTVWHTDPLVIAAIYCCKRKICSYQCSKANLLHLIQLTHFHRGKMYSLEKQWWSLIFPAFNIPFVSFFPYFQLQILETIQIYFDQTVSIVTFRWYFLIMLGSPAQSDSVRGALGLLGAGQSHLSSEGDCMTSRGSVNRLCFSLYISYWHWYLGSICHRYNQANCLADCCNTSHLFGINLLHYSLI